MSDADDVTHGTDAVAVGAGGCPAAARARAFDIFHADGDSVADPYPLLRELQRDCPLTRSDRFDGYWIATRYEDVSRILRDPVRFSSAENFIPPTADPVFGKAIPLQIDRPDHTLYRRVIAPFFSPAAVARLEAKTREAARELIEPIAAGERCEFVGDFCAPFPALVFLPLLGLSRDELDDLLALHTELLEFNRIGPGEAADIGQRRIAASRALRDRIDTLLDDRAASADPPDDIVTGLLRSQDGERTLERQEAVRLVRLFFSAGLDTVKSTLSMMVWFLASHPDERRRLVQDPAAIPGAVEEFLRYFSPTSFARIATEDVDFGEVTIRAGEMVLFSTLVANRDPQRFPDPDAVDFARLPNPHLGLGAGPHRCAGSHLARMELTVALEEIHRAMPEYEVLPGAEVPWHAGTIIGVDQLALTIGGGDRSPR